MNFRGGSFFCLSAAAFFLGVSGCGGSGNPKTYPVTGAVTHRGEPVAGAVVSFTPTEDGSAGVAAGRAASGQTDEQGRYSLTTFERNDGALAGSYKVVVSKLSGPAPGAAGSGEEDWDNYVPPDEQAARPAEVKQLLPPRYASAEQTPLQHTVESGENVFDITIED